MATKKAKGRKRERALDDMDEVRDKKREVSKGIQILHVVWCVQSTSRVVDERGNGRPDGCGGVRRSMVGARGEGVEVGLHSCTLQKVICNFDILFVI